MAPQGRIYKKHIKRDTLIQELYGSRNMERKDINYVFEETAKVPKLEQQPYVNPEIMKVIYSNQPKIILEKYNKMTHS
jgi:hypothetical protein